MLERIDQMFRSLWYRITRTQKDIDCISLSKNGVEFAACNAMEQWRLETPQARYTGPGDEAGCYGFSGAFAQAVRLAAEAGDSDASEALKEINDALVILDPIEEQYLNDISPEVHVKQK